MAINCPECLKEGKCVEMFNIDADSDGETYIVITKHCPNCGFEANWFENIESD